MIYLVDYMLIKVLGFAFASWTDPQWLGLPTLPEWAGDSRNSSQSPARRCESPGIPASRMKKNVPYFGSYNTIHNIQLIT